MPGKPAARLGDLTAHGGSIVMGFPMVLIGSMLAARVGDMHVCPMFNGPVPHVGGPILPPGSIMVLIGGQPAARVGDQCTCVGPPDVIAMGCPTVLIGDSGSGGAGAGAGGGSAGAASASGGSTTESDVGTAEDGSESSSAVAKSHYLDVKFLDKGGFPISGVHYVVTSPDSSTSSGMLAGQVKLSGVEPGSYEIALKAITSAKWSVDSAKVGDTVTLLVETAGVDSGKPAKLDIYVKDANFADSKLKTLDGSVSGDKIEVEWKVEIDEDFLKDQQAKAELGPFSSPYYYFLVNVDGMSQKSGLMALTDDLEVKLLDDEGKPIGDRKFRMILLSGEVRQSTLDSSGYAKEEKLPPGKLKVAFEIRDQSFGGGA